VTLDELDSGLQAVRDELGSRGIGILRLEPIRPAMEDVFVSLIEEEERRSA
jgi:hypothetical protein